MKFWTVFFKYNTSIHLIIKVSSTKKSVLHIIQNVEVSAVHWTTLFSHVSGRLEIRKLCNFCGSSSSWAQTDAVFCSWHFHWLLHLRVHSVPQVPSFFFKISANKPGRNPAIYIYFGAARWAKLPQKQLELIFSALSALPSWESRQNRVRDDGSPLLRWHGGERTGCGIPERQTE